MLDADYAEQAMQYILTLLEEQDWHWSRVPLNATCLHLHELLPRLCVYVCVCVCVCACVRACVCVQYLTHDVTLMQQLMCAGACYGTSIHAIIHSC